MNTILSTDIAVHRDAPAHTHTYSLLTVRSTHCEIYACMQQVLELLFRPSLRSGAKAPSPGLHSSMREVLATYSAPLAMVLAVLRMHAYGNSES